MLRLISKFVQRIRERLLQGLKAGPPVEIRAPLTLPGLQETLARRGLVMYTDGRRLLFCSLWPVLDDVLVLELQRHRQELLQILPRKCDQRAA